jgi:hypothetical protein
LSPTTTTRAFDVVCWHACFGLQPRVQEGTVSDTESGLLKQRSMLVILIDACSTARTTFEAADNAIDASLLNDLSTMIDRSERKLVKLNQEIQESS